MNHNIKSDDPVLDANFSLLYKIPGVLLEIKNAECEPFSGKIVFPVRLEYIFGIISFWVYARLEYSTPVFV